MQFLESSIHGYKSWSWNKHPTDRKGKAWKHLIEKSLLLKSQSLPLILYWLELSHMAIPNFKEAKKCNLSSEEEENNNSGM